MSILDFMSATGWAMYKPKADELITIAERAHEVSPEILEKYRAQTAERGERLKTRDGVGILRIEGPLFKKANLFVEMSGATSYQILRRDLQAALDDDDIHSIALLVDSPGGEANGCDELAAAIYEARGQKPITAYVSGMAASGGYWLAAASDRIVISDGAMLGSIGVVLGIEDHSVSDEKRGIKKYQFVSSQSPGKRPDPGSEDGSNQIQTMVDDLAEVFVAAVAKYRNVTVEDVLANFGAGGMKVGAKAVAAGMADEVGQFETVISTLIESGNRRSMQRSFGGFTMSDKTNAQTADEAAAQVRIETQARIKSIIGCDDGKAMPTLANHLAFDTEISAADAGKILSVALADQPKVEASGSSKEDDEEARAAIKAAAYEASKAEAGTLGLGSPEITGGVDKSKAAWGKAVTTVNASAIN